MKLKTISANIEIDIREKEYNDDYNPYEHRAVKNANSDTRSAANLIKSSLGSGLLAMPLAFSNAGYGVGLIGTVIIGIICAHCVHILVHSSYIACKLKRVPLMTYSETCEAAFMYGPKPLRSFSTAAKYFAEWALSFTYLAVCCVYTILIAQSIQQLVGDYWPKSVETYCAVLLIPLVLISQIRSLKWLAPFSMLANALLVAVFAICLYYIFRNGINPEKFEQMKLFGELGRFPAYLSTVIFAMEGIGVVMPTENTMAKPQNFLGCPSVLNISMIIITTLYTALGFFGYLQYGDQLKGSLTLNLPMDEVPAICAKAFIVLAIFFTYSLQFYIPIDILWTYTHHKFPKNRHNLIQTVFRILIVAFTVAIGTALPMLEEVINIVGAFFYSILGLIIPAIVETVMRWDTGLGKFNWILWKNILLFLFGMGALISGCTLAIEDMIEKIHNAK